MNFWHTKNFCSLSVGFLETNLLGLLILLMLSELFKTIFYLIYDLMQDMIYQNKGGN